jgi:hypothetical protein
VKQLAVTFDMPEDAAALACLGGCGAAAWITGDVVVRDAGSPSLHAHTAVRISCDYY